MRRLSGTSGVIDLASIMVGVVVLAIVGGIAAVALTTVIPWTQDLAARETLNTVRVAQATAKMNSGSYVNYDKLVAAGLTKDNFELDALVGNGGKCYVAGARSASGTIFYGTSGSATVLSNASGVPDTSWCESSAYMFTRATNLATNPSFEAVAAGTPTSRTNLALDPAATGINHWNRRWFGPDAPWAGSYSQSATGGPVGGPKSFVRKTWTGSPSWNGNTGFEASGSSSPAGNKTVVTPGKTLTLSGWLRTSAANKETARAKLMWYDSESVSLPSDYGSSNDLITDSWTRISATAVVPANAAYVVALLDLDFGTVWVAGDTLDGTGALLEYSNVVGQYFDGSTTTTNLATNPRAATATAFNANSAAYNTVTRPVPIIGHPAGITTAAKSVVGSTPNSAVLSVYNVDGLINTGPERYLGAWVYVSADGYKANWDLDTPVDLPKNTWVFLRMSSIHPAGAWTGIYVRTASGANAPSSDFAYVTGVVAQTDRPVGGFYDTSRQDFTYGWTGTVGWSTSQERSVRPTEASLGGVTAISSQEWSSSGSTSLRVRITTGRPGTGYVGIGGDIGALRLGLKPGKTYTASAKVMMAGARGVAVPRLQAYTRIGSAAYVNAISNLPSDVAGVTDLRVTFTVPEGATEAFVRVINYAPEGSDDVWFDDFMLTEGVYTGKYFDGSSDTWSWSGPANGSTSSGYTVTVP